MGCNGNCDAHLIPRQGLSVGGVVFQARDLRVNFQMARGYGLGAEGVFGALPGGGGKLVGRCWFGKETFDGYANRVRLKGIEEKAGDAVVDQVGDAAGARGGDGNSSGHAFEDRNGTIFFERGKDKQGGARQRFFDSSGVNGAGDVTPWAGGGEL